jgi:hypothetical protein
LLPAGIWGAFCIVRCVLDATEQMLLLLLLLLTTEL